MLKGRGIVKEIENLSTTLDVPEFDCVIEECGEVTSDLAPVSKDERDPYPEWPIDWEGELEIDQILQIASKMRELGNEHFKAGSYQDAYRKYTKAIRYLNEKPIMEDEDDDKDGKLYSAYIQQKLSAYLNRAACALRLGNSKGAINDAGLVVDAAKSNDTKAKALFRRGKAFVIRGDDDSAVEDFSAARKLTADAGIEQELQAAKKRLAVKKQKQQKVFSTLFSE